MAWTLMASPVDELLLTTDGAALTAVWFSPHKGTAQNDLAAAAGERVDDHPVLAEARSQLAAYFAGDLTDFDLPLAPAGSGFQQRVWAALREIPYATTCSYGDIAARLGLRPGASRAVGLANGSNPVSVVVPCHRVIGADGSLTGYGGGLARKRWLLDHELRHAGATLF